MVHQKSLLKSHFQWSNTILLFIFYFLISNPYIATGQGDIQVDPTTGRANMHIPLWTVQSKDIRHPIALSYGTGGIKVGMPIGKAGLGWSLIAGGMITRELRGLPDDFEDTRRKGWLKANAGSSTEAFYPGGDDNWSSASDERFDHTTLEAFGGYDGEGTILDTEPDIFHIHVPGLSGSFIINHDGAINSMSYVDYQIIPDYSANGTIRGFKIVNTQGITYRFERTDSQTVQSFKNEHGGPLMLDVRNYYSFTTPVTFKKTWYLTEVSSAQGGRLSFEYEPVEHSEQSSDYFINSWVSERQDTLKTYRFNALSGQYEAHWEYYLNVSETRPYDLTAIVGTSSKVTFTQGDVLLPSSILVAYPYLKRLDIKMRKPLLSKVSIYVRTHENQPEAYAHQKSFLLNYGYASLLNDDNSHQVFLKSVFTEGHNRKTLELFNFTYHGVRYGQSANMPVAHSWSKDPFGYFNGGPSESLFQTYVQPGTDDPLRYGLQPISGSETYVLPGKNGAPNLQAATVGSLASVTNTFGGATTISYELNDAYHPEMEQNIYAGGLRVKTVRVHDGMDRANDQVFRYEYQQADGASSGLLMHQPSYAFHVGFGWDFSTHQPVYYRDLLDQGLNKEALWKHTIFRTERDVRFEAQNASSVVYQQVTVKQDGKGRTVYHYDWPVANETLNFSGWVSPKTRLARIADPARTYYNFGPLDRYHAYPHGPLPQPGYRQGLLRKMQVFDEVGNIEEETNHEYQYLQTDPVQALRIGQLPVLSRSGTTDVEEKMFVYRIYELQTGNLPLISRTTTKSFDAIDQNQWQTDVLEFTYPTPTSAYPTYPTGQYGIDSKGTKRGRKFKYPFNYTTPGNASPQDAATRAIAELKEKNIMAVPTEVIHTYQEVGGAEAVIGGSLNEYAYIHAQDVVKLSKQYALRLEAPVGNFQASAIQGFTHLMDSRYEAQSKVIARDQWGNAITVEGVSKVPVTTLTAMQGALSVATFSHAVYGQVAYENFENRDFENLGGFMPTSDNYSGGRISGRGFGLENVSYAQLTKHLSKHGSDKFMVSMWLNTAYTGTLTIRASAGGQTATVPLSFESTADTWKYHEATLDVSTLAEDFTVTIHANAETLVDDVLVHPLKTAVRYVTYNEQLIRVAETTNGGLTTRSHLDDLNRPWYNQNHQEEVTSIFEYTTENQSLGRLDASFSGSHSVEPGDEATFYQISPTDEAQYAWVAGPMHSINYEEPDLVTFPPAKTGLAGGGRYMHTFTNVGNYVVLLKVTLDGRTSYDYRRVDVKSSRLTVEICTEGILYYNTCPNATSDDHARTNCALISNVNTIQTKFLANITDGSNPVSYQWQTKTASQANWQNVGNTAQYSITSYGTSNILVRCQVQTSSGIHITPIQEVVVGQLNNCEGGLSSSTLD